MNSMTRHITENQTGVPQAVIERYQEALTLWLRWNDAHERINASLFEARQDLTQSAELLDQLDFLRQKAVKLSSELLDRTTD